MAMNSASDALMSVGSMMQKPAVNTKDQKLPSDKGSFQDAIKEELNKPNETSQPKDTTKDKTFGTEKPANEIGDEVLEEAAGMMQNPMLQLWNQDMMTTLLRNGNANDMAQVVVQNVPVVEEVQTAVPVNTKQTKLSDAQMLQPTNGKVETENTNGNKQEIDILQPVKNEVQIQKPVENTNGKQLQQTTKEQTFQQPVEQDLKNVEVTSEMEEIQKPVQPMMLQTKQKTEAGEVVHVKVADVLPVTKGNVAEQLADKILLRSSNEFELQLNPESLGKIQIKVRFDKGETKVSILCESAKAMHLLSENTSSLATLLESRTGNQTTIQMHESKDAFYKQETDQNGHQQQQQTKEEQQQRQQKQKHQESIDFLQQMRLGLV